MLNSPIFNSQRTQITDLAVKNRLPTIYWATEFVEAGGLMTYSVSFTDLFRRAATYVDKILKGPETGRSASGAAKEVRVHHKSEGGETDRLDNST